MPDNAPTANTLIFDLFQVHGAPCLAVADLMRAAQLFGVQEAALRVALTRLLKQGRLTNPQRGLYVLGGADGMPLEQAERWLARERRVPAWQGAWLAVSDGQILRSDKSLWRRHQRALGLRGFRRLAEGFYLRPDNLHDGIPALHAELLGLGMAEQALLLGVDRLDAASQRRSRELWEGARLSLHYARLIERLDASQRQLAALPAAEALRQSLVLGHEAVCCLLHDPLLPAELLGGDLRVRLVQRTRQYHAAAQRQWRRFLGAAPG